MDDSDSSLDLDLEALPDRTPPWVWGLLTFIVTLGIGLALLYVWGEPHGP